MATKTITRAGQWGNSVGVRLSDAMAEETGIRAGCPVSIKVVPSGVLIERQTTNPSLKELVARITPENRHEYAWKGLRPVGRELW